MLVLSRKPSQRIVLNIDGEQAILEILNIGGNKVRIGIVAPRTMPICRKEIWDDPQADAMAIATST